MRWCRECLSIIDESEKSCYCTKKADNDPDYWPAIKEIVMDWNKDLSLKSMEKKKKRRKEDVRYELS